MKDYASMSDFEINQMVSACLWGSIYAVDGVVLHNERDGAFDPCNNPADAWAIIVASKVSMQFDYLVDEWTASCVGEMYYHQKCESPLRAAMIVFLMMKEGE